MGIFSDVFEGHRAEYEDTQPEHKAKLSHELISGAAAYEAAKEYEKYSASHGGGPPSHAHAKELLAGFVGAFIDREAETKGLSQSEAEKAKSHANDRLSRVITQDNYGAMSSSQY